MGKRAVIFDFFGTLIDGFSRPAYREMLTAMAELLGVPPDDLISQWMRTFDLRITGKLSTIEGNLEYICNQLGRKADPDAIVTAAAIRLEHTVKEIVPRPHAIEVLEELRRRGIKTGLLSDCTIEIALAWPRTPFAPLFDVAVFSCVEHLTKPDPAIYLRAVERLGVSPAECLYVGDGGSQELSGALKVGMKPVQITLSEEGAKVYRIDPEDWDGPVIDCLTAVLDLV
ncbi:MAG: HAD-IA family hydrolase [Actinomycetota bacterium]